MEEVLQVLFKDILVNALSRSPDYDPEPIGLIARAYPRNRSLCSSDTRLETPVS
jgi:hypothetical protein